MDVVCYTRKKPPSNICLLNMCTGCCAPSISHLHVAVSVRRRTGRDESSSSPTGRLSPSNSPAPAYNLEQLLVKPTQKTNVLIVLQPFASLFVFRYYFSSLVQVCTNKYISDYYVYNWLLLFIDLLAVIFENYLQDRTRLYQKRSFFSNMK